MENTELENQIDFILEVSARFQEFLGIYEAGMQKVVTKLEILNKEFQAGKGEKPIESIKSRVKSPQSIVGKLKRKGLPCSFQMMAEHLHDIAGIRVTCPFISDVYHVAGLLCSQDDITLVETKDYITEPKPNGYRSLHLIISTPVYFSSGSHNIFVEIQIRTVGMDSWASLEHRLCYKKDYRKTPEIVAELKKCADTIADNDIRMQKIASDLELFQENGESRLLLLESLEDKGSAGSDMMNEKDRGGA